MSVPVEIQDAIRSRFPLSGESPIVMTADQFLSAFRACFNAIASLRIHDPRFPTDPSRTVPEARTIAAGVAFLVDRVQLYTLRTEAEMNDARRSQYRSVLRTFLVTLTAPDPDRPNRFADVLWCYRDESNLVYFAEVLDRLYSLQLFLFAPGTSSSSQIEADEAFDWFTDALHLLYTGGPHVSTRIGAPSGFPGAASAVDSPMAGAYTSAVIAAPARVRIGVDGRRSNHTLRVATWNSGQNDHSHRWDSIAEISYGTHPGDTGGGVDVLAVQEVPDSFPSGESIDPWPGYYPPNQRFQERRLTDQYASADISGNPGWRVRWALWQPFANLPARWLYVLYTDRRDRQLALIVRQELRWRRFRVIGFPDLVVRSAGALPERSRPAFGVELSWVDEPDNPITIYSLHAETGTVGQPAGFNCPALLSAVHTRTPGRFIVLGDFNTEPPDGHLSTPTGARYFLTPPGQNTHIVRANPTAQNDRRLDYMVANPGTTTIPHPVEGRRLDFSGHIRQGWDGPITEGLSDHCAVIFSIPGRPPLPPGLVDGSTCVIASADGEWLMVPRADDPEIVQPVVLRPRTFGADGNQQLWVFRSSYEDANASSDQNWCAFEHYQSRREDGVSGGYLTPMSNRVDLHSYTGEAILPASRLSLEPSGNGWVIHRTAISPDWPSVTIVSTGLEQQDSDTGRSIALGSVTDNQVRTLPAPNVRWLISRVLVDGESYVIACADNGWVMESDSSHTVVLGPPMPGDLGQQWIFKSYKDYSALINRYSGEYLVATPASMNGPSAVRSQAASHPVPAMRFVLTPTQTSWILSTTDSSNSLTVGTTGLQDQDRRIPLSLRPSHRAQDFADLTHQWVFNIPRL